MHDSQIPSDPSEFPASQGYEYDYPRQSSPRLPDSTPPPQSPPPYEPLYQFPAPQPPINPPPPTAMRQPIELPERLDVPPPYIGGKRYEPPQPTQGRPPRRAPSGTSNAGVWVKRIALFLIGSLLVLVCGGGVAIAGAYAYYAKELPSADQLATTNTEQSKKIYHRNGGLLLPSPGPESWDVIPSSHPKKFRPS